MFSGYKKEEKPSFGPDSGEKAPKPAPPPKAQAPRKSFFSLTGGPGVIQRIKLRGVEVDFKDQTVLAAIKAVLMALDGFDQILGIPRFAGLTRDQAAEGAIRLAAPILERSPQKCGDYAAVAGLVLQFALRQQFLPGTRQTAYTVGGTAASFDEEDWQALQADSLLVALRERANAPLVDSSEVNLGGTSKKKPRYTDFYSRSAMREDVTRSLIESGLGAQPTSAYHRQANRYVNPGFGEGEDVPLLQQAFSKVTQNHIMPLNQLNAGFQKDTSEDLQMSRDRLVRTQWQKDNLVFGADEDERIYDGLHGFDVEADYVRQHSQDRVKMTDVLPEDGAEQVSLVRESKDAYMKTQYLQRFYKICLDYIETGTEGTKNPLTYARLLSARFQLIETRHNNPKLLRALHAFIDVFKDSSSTLEAKKSQAQQMAGEILAYGLSEDAQNMMGSEEEDADAVPSSSSVPSSSASASSALSSAAAAPPSPVPAPVPAAEEGPRHPIVELNSWEAAENRPWNRGDRFAAPRPDTGVMTLFEVQENYHGDRSYEKLDVRIKVRGG